MVVDPDDPADAEALAADLRAGGVLSEDLLRVLGWDEPPDGFDVEVVDPIADLGEDGLIEGLLDAHRMIASSQGRLFLLITEIARRRAEDAITELTGRHARGVEALSIGARSIIEEVRLELGLSMSAARNLADTALGLVTEAPDTFEALLGGGLDLDKATVILRLVQSLVAAQTDTNTELGASEQTDPDQLGKDLEKKLLEKAGQQSTAALKKAGELGRTGAR